MIGVGIDVAKSKSMVAILSDDGEIIKNPFEIANTESGLEYLCKIIRELAGDVYCVVESTSIYHIPVVSYLQENNIMNWWFVNLQKKHHKSEICWKDSRLITRFQVMGWSLKY